MASALSKRLDSLRLSLAGNSPSMNRALMRIGILVQQRAVLNARKLQIVNTGALINSIQFRVSGQRVTIGSFGVRYARFHEFGATLHPAAVRAMFASFKRGPQQVKRSRDKNVMTFSNGSATLKPRPYLIPAFESSRERIMAIVQKELFGG